MAAGAVGLLLCRGGGCRRSVLVSWRRVLYVCCCALAAGAVGLVPERVAILGRWRTSRLVPGRVAILGRWRTSRLVPDARRLVFNHSTAADDGSMISGV